jgi:hypothetical protein
MKNPKLLMQLGNICFIIGALSMYKLHPVTPFWDGLKDGFTGTMYGAAIAFMLLSVRLNARRKAGLSDTHCV